MSATLHRIGTEALLTKQQLAHSLGRSTRWIELRVREGMPSQEPTSRYGSHRFRFSNVEMWMRENGHLLPEERQNRLPISRRSPYASGRAEDFAYVDILRDDPCSYCGSASATSIDHIDPVSRGGEHEWSNFTGACLVCNSRKKDSRLLVFLTRTRP